MEYQGTNHAQDAARLLRLSVFVWLLLVTLAMVTDVMTNFHVGMYLRDENIILIVLLASMIGLAFQFARFSFGYLVGFYLYAMMAGYFWFNTFGTLGYDRRTALISSSASIILFLIPSLLITGPARKPFTLPRWALDALPLWIFSLLALVFVLATPNEFRIVAPSEMYNHRDALQQSRIVGYALGNCTGALIPFAFAWFVARRQWFALSLLGGLSLLFYTVTITKLSLVLPFYLGFIAILASRYEARSVVILSLLIPIVVAFVLRDFDSGITRAIWGFVALRLVAIPAITLDHYFVFFTDHPLTYFCQINFVKAFTDCPYKEQLGVVFQNWFRLGNMNGSLFATEGVASVGPLYAPIVAFICGAVIAIGNKVSADLPKSFILTSAAVMPHVLLNVPLTTALLSNGLGLLFVLWYLTPIGYFSIPAAATDVIPGQKEQLPRSKRNGPSSGGAGAARCVGAEKTGPAHPHGSSQFLDHSCTGLDIGCDLGRVRDLDAGARSRCWTNRLPRLRAQTAWPGFPGRGPGEISRVATSMQLAQPFGPEALSSQYRVCSSVQPGTA